MILVAANFLLLNHLAPTSKKELIFKLRACETTLQSNCATAQSKNKCWTVSCSVQKRHESVSTSCLFARLSLVRILFLERSHRKICTLGGIFKSQTLGTKTGMTPLKLMILYIDCEVNTPSEVNCQIRLSSHSENSVVEAI